MEILDGNFGCFGCKGNFGCFAQQTQEDVAEYEKSKSPISPRECYCVTEKLKLINKTKKANVFNKLLLKYQSFSKKHIPLKLFR